jgi:hypothetical protein
MFSDSPSVEFIPKDLINEFSNLEGLLFVDCTMSIIEDDLFTEKFNFIKYLYLKANKIRHIEGDAFSKLTELVWFSLTYNKLQSINQNIFKHNLKLKHIDLSSNQLTIVTPSLLADLKYLNLVDLRSNTCIDSKISQSYGKLSSAIICQKLEKCYKNYNSEYCSEIIKPSQDENRKIKQNYESLQVEIEKIQQKNKELQSENGKLQDECSGKPMALIIFGIQIILFIFSVVIFVTFYGINRKFAGLNSEK